ncbi:MAG: DMT family transporter [Chitinophagaceae bacterium]|nr:MAG: DMT family transporter [Chitinophagaceae bacterium]
MTKRNIYIGIILAVTATIVWSGNFIVARGVIKQIPPVSLAFYRWLMGSIFILPIGYKKFRQEIPLIRKHWKYLLWVAFTGITLYNTFLYVAGHYTPAINLALIATTTSPIMAIALAAIFLKEKISLLRLAGLSICIVGILLLLSQGNLDRLLGFHFSTGDWWLLAGALCFAVYNVLVKQKPVTISATSFLVAIFWAGTAMLLPAYLWEKNNNPPVVFDAKLLGIIVYLGLGACVISYLCWNAAIAKLGSGRTALFGNLIPIFSTLEAVLILDERIMGIHLISGALVITGLVLANISSPKSVPGTGSMPLKNAANKTSVNEASLIKAGRSANTTEEKNDY